MFMPGNMYFTTDIQLCLTQCNTYKTIIVSDDIPSDMIPNSVPLSILMPEYKAISQLVDGNMQGFIESYFEYLSSPYTDKTILILIQAMMKGINLLVLFDKDAETTFMPALKEFLLKEYGIIAGDQAIMCSFNLVYIPRILDKLYMYGNITAEQYLLMFPENTIILPAILKKLEIDHGVAFPNALDSLDYYTSLSYNLKRYGMMKYNPLKRGNISC